MPRKKNVRLLQGDCRKVLHTLDENSIDACVTDPPYGLKFMRKHWDHGVPGKAYWREVYDVLKPGAFLLAFGGTRTYHRLACAIEDAGFEVRDMVAWLYGSGFPKSMDISKAIDKAAGAEREKLRIEASKLNNPPNLVGGAVRGDDRPWRQRALARGYHEKDGDTPITPQVVVWNGWGTAIKPALEPVCMARKPLSEKTVTANVLKWGTGAINIDGCRVEAVDQAQLEKNYATVRKSGPRTNKIYGVDDRDRSSARAHDAGRFPANVIHDGSDDVLRLFSRADNARSSAARFFYTTKADKNDRAGSQHPTVKPVLLLRYLCKLITPPNGIVLDPFAGTGTTGIAALSEDFSTILIEKEAEYVADIRRRFSKYDFFGTKIFDLDAAE